MMRRILWVAAVWGLMIAGGLHAQIIPLAIGSQWLYQSSGGDTIRVAIVATGSRTLPCAGGKRKHPAWFDNEGRCYLRAPAGMAICESGTGDSLTRFQILLPHHFRRDTSPPSNAGGCTPSYTFVGLAPVTTPMGVFDQCLIYDDGSIHRIYVAPGIGIVREERYKETNGRGAGERVIVSTRVLVGYGR